MQRWGRDRGGQPPRIIRRSGSILDLPWQAVRWDNTVGYPKQVIGETGNRLAPPICDREDTRESFFREPWHPGSVGNPARKVLNETH